MLVTKERELTEASSGLTITEMIFTNIDEDVDGGRGGSAGAAKLA